MAGFEIRFSTEMAKKYGTDEAIVLYNIAHWVHKNTIDQRNIHAGKVWTYNTQSALVKVFDEIFSRRQIQRILRNLEDKGAIIKGNFNRKPMDRTLWYTVSEEVMAFYGIEAPPSGVESAEMDRPSDLVPCKAPNGAMESTEPCTPKHETVPAIPDNKPDNKHKETLSDGAGVNQEEQFKQFWDRYPRGDAKKKTREKWMRLNPDPALFAKIMAGLERSIRSDQWRRGIIPHAVTWLNGERWEDDLPDNGPAGPNAAVGPNAPKRIDPGEGYRYV